MEKRVQNISQIILGQLKRAGCPLSLEEIFVEITEDHLEAIHYLTKEAESVEPVYPKKYQLR